METTETKQSERKETDEDSFADKARRVLSVLNEEELKSIQETAKASGFLSPKLKGKAGTAMMLLFAIFAEENKYDKICRKESL